MAHRKSPHFFSFSIERPEDWRQEAKQLIYTHLYQFMSANRVCILKSWILSSKKERVFCYKIIHLGNFNTAANSNSLLWP